MIRRIACALVLMSVLFGPAMQLHAQVGLRGKPAPVHDVIPEAFTGDAIEEAINIVNQFGGKVSLPPGVYTVNRTISLSRINAMTITGTGPGRMDGYYGKAGVTLVWAGPAGQPMIKQVAHGVTWQNVTFDGQDRASIGIQCLNIIGFAASRNVFEDCLFARFTDVCVQMGQGESDQNVDFSHFLRCGFTQSGAGFVVTSNQSVIHRFDECDFGGLKTAIDVRYGGAINIFGGACTYSDVFIHVTKCDHNTGGINVVGTKIEAEGYTRKYMKLVEANKGDGNGVQITLDQVRMSNAYNDKKPDTEAPTIDIGPRVSVTVRDSFLKQSGDWPLAKLWGSKEIGEAVLHIEDSMLWGDLNKIKADEFSRLYIIDPMDEKGHKSPSVIRENKP